MPFTFAHPAAVFPVYRALQRHAVLSALIIGSMVPDFQYFLPFDVDRGESHSLAGIAWFCLPVGMALYLVFHLLLKLPIVALLPPALVARIVPAPGKAPLLPRASGLAIAASLLIGILTHLAWDAFTHYSWLTAFILPSLSSYLFSVGEYHVYPYKILQHASTAAGSVFVWLWARHQLSAAPDCSVTTPATLSGRQRHAAIGILLALPPVLGLWLALQSYTASYGLMGVKDFVREAVIIAISSFGVLLLTYSMIWQLLVQRRKTEK